MAKLTLTFKGKPIRAYQFDEGDRISIGRNDENEIRIDSLAIAPVHARIEIEQARSTITQVEDEHPLLVNNVRTKRQELQHGDQISIGKHVLFFTEDSTLLESPTTQDPIDDAPAQDQTNPDDDLRQYTQLCEGQLQILNGRNIGRVISLRGGLTRLGKPETGIAVIAKRKDGFYVASLDGLAQIKLNEEMIHDKSVKLNHGDLLEIDRVEMQFFLNNSGS